MTEQRFVVGAEATTHLHSRRMRPGRRLQEAGPLVPQGRVHAVDQAAGRTACGRDARRLHLFDQPWDRGLLQRCPHCLEAVPLS